MNNENKFSQAKHMFWGYIYAPSAAELILFYIEMSQLFKIN